MKISQIVWNADMKMNPKLNAQQSSSFFEIEWWNDQIA